MDWIALGTIVLIIGGYFAVDHFLKKFNRWVRDLNTRRARRFQSEEWILEQLDWVIPLGFFSALKEKSGAARATGFKNFYRQACSGHSWEDTSWSLPKVALQSFLAADLDRVWWPDTECDVGPGNDRYVNTLQRLARISRGRFRPEMIEERWKSEAGPLAVSFRWNGRSFSLHPQYQEDYLDLGILKTINEWLPATAGQYLLGDTGDQTAYILLVTEEERAILQSSGLKLGEP